MATSITRKTLREGAASELSLYVPVTADVVNTTSHTVEISDVRKKLPDRFGIIDSFLMSRESGESGSVFQRVLRWEEGTTDTLLLTDDVTNLANTHSAGLYFLLSPEDWNEVINEELEKLWKEYRVAITLTANDNEYSMDSITDGENDTCTYLQTRNQVYGLRLRVTDGANYASEYDWAGVRIIESANGLTVHMTSMPNVNNSTTTSLVLDVQKPYVWRDSTLTDDANTTTCPYKMAMAAVQVGAMRRLYKRHGADQMRSRFGAALAVTEQTLIEEKNAYMKPMRPVGYKIDEPFVQDLPHEMSYWSW